MTKRKMFTLAALGFGLMVGAIPTPAQPDAPKAAAQPAPGKSVRAKEFIAAFNKGDAKAVASFWTKDGEYTDQLGRLYKGQEAIEKLFQKAFAARKGATLTITVISARQISDDVALQEGLTEVAPSDGGVPTAAHFNAVLVKKSGQWYFESVRDSVARPPTNAAHFDDLEWLIGNWAGPEKGESATASYHWAENQNFIVSSFATTLNGVPVVGGTQWISWDAVDKKIRSYSFYSGGGVGEAVWTKDGNTWRIDVTAKSADGKKLSATSLLGKVDANNATWQVTKLTVDGNTIPDGPVVKLKRVAAE
jgi:uncharacterized protein (TIGR02246 family)